MRAHAHLTVTADGDRTRISRLHSEVPLILRPTIAADAPSSRRWVPDNAAHVALAAAAAGPLGGDRLQLDVEVGAGASLALRGVSATLALPGPHNETSRTDVRVRVAEGAALLWQPRPVIAARGCDHRATTLIDLAPGARLLVREEILLGRHGEQPGTLRQRLRVTATNRPLYDQELAFGPGVPGWSGPAVTAGRKAVGTLLVVDPGSPAPWPHRAPEPDVATLAAGEHTLVVSALADDYVTLRQRLDVSLDVSLAALETHLAGEPETLAPPLPVSL
nr:UreD [Streptomyces sp.]